MRLQSGTLGAAPDSLPPTLLGSPTILDRSVWANHFPYAVPNILGRQKLLPCLGTETSLGEEGHPFHTHNPSGLGFSSWELCSWLNLSQREATKLTFIHHGKVYSAVDQDQERSYSSPSFLRRTGTALLTRSPSPRADKTPCRGRTMELEKHDP